MKIKHKGKTVNLSDEDVRLGKEAGEQAATGENPASWVEDEDIWNKAKEAADKNKGTDNYYALVTYIYKEMGGTIKSVEPPPVRRAVRAAHGEVTGKPSFATLQTKVNQVIQSDARWDGQRGWSETAKVYFDSPWCVDVLVPDDDAELCAVIRTSAGKLVKHYFRWDGETIAMDEGDSEPTDTTTVYSRAIQERDKIVRADFQSSKGRSCVQCREVGIAIKAKKTWVVGEPVDFQWMPGGIHTITASYGRGKNNRPIRLVVQVDAEGAEAVQASFEQLKADSPRRPPYGCVEHRAEERAFEPIKFDWRDEPEPAIYLTSEPSELGVRNVNGKTHTSFSPTFDTDADYHLLKCSECDKKSGKCVCSEPHVWIFPDGARGSETNPAHVTRIDAQSVGSLTNWPAFREILPIAARQADPQPANNPNAETKVIMKVKLIKARGNHAAGALVELADAEAVQAIASGDAMTEREAAAIEAREKDTTELATIKAAEKKRHEDRIKASVVRAKERNAILKQDDAVQATAIERFNKGSDPDLIVEFIDGLPAKKTGLGERQTTSDGGSVRGVEVVSASLDDLGKAYMEAQSPVMGLVRAGNFKEAFSQSRESGVRLKQIMGRGDDFLLRDVIRAADYTDPNSQVGTLATGLVLMRNLGFLKNRLNWLPYFSTDLRNEPAQFGQPIFTRYLTPPAVATFVPGVGFTTDASTISTASAGTNQSGVQTQASGTRTLSVPSATDVTVTLNQFKGVPLAFPVTTLAATPRNLFAEQRGAQLYALAEHINSHVLGKIFAATWTGPVTSFAITNLDLKGFLTIKNRMELSKVPDIGRYALMHSYFQDGLQADGNLLTAKAILALINKDQSSFEEADMPPIFGVRPLGSQLAIGTIGSATLGTATIAADGSTVTFGSNNAVGFAGNMSSMLFVARIPQDFTQAANQLGIPASYGVEIVTEPDSGLSLMIFKNVNTATWSIEVTACLMYGAAQGDPRVGIVLKP